MNIRVLDARESQFHSQMMTMPSKGNRLKMKRLEINKNGKSCLEFSFELARNDGMITD